MYTPDSLYQAICEQNRQIHTCMARDDTRHLLKHLKRRSVLFHQMGQLLETGTSESQTLVRHFLTKLLETNQELQEQVSGWHEGVESQIRQQRKQRRATRAYRSSHPHYRPMMLT